MQLSQTDKGTVSGAENKFMSGRERKRERERETSWSLRVFAGLCTVRGLVPFETSCI